MRHVELLTFVVLGSVGLAGLAGCGTQTGEANLEKPAVTINALKLTPAELKEELALAAVTSHEEFPAVAGEEPEWLSRLIERELLVQEAQRLGLDRQPAFIRTIERFWKEALMTRLLDRKGQEVIAEVHVYEPEIEAYYEEQFSQESQGPGVRAMEPLSVVRDDIRRTIQHQKQAAAMDRWIAQLKHEAHIIIDHEAIAQLQ